MSNEKPAATGGNTSFEASTTGEGAGIQQASTMDNDNSTGKQVNNIDGDGATVSQTNTIDQSVENHWAPVDEAVATLPEADQAVVFPVLDELRPMAAMSAFDAPETENRFKGLLEKLKPYEPLIGPIKAVLQATPIGAVAIPIAEAVFGMLSD